MTDAVREASSVQADEEVTRLLPVIFDSIADGVTVLDRAGTIRYANAAAARLMGYERASELVGRSSDSVTSRFDLLADDGRPIDPSVLPTRRAYAGPPVP